VGGRGRGCEGKGKGREEKGRKDRMRGWMGRGERRRTFSKKIHLYRKDYF
jgi:hypothetical protein